MNPVQQAIAAARQQARQQRRSKYGNTKVVDVVTGSVIDSKAEAKRLVELRLLESRGLIKELRSQVTYKLLSRSGEHVADYIPDFVYRDVATNELVVEDVKSAATLTSTSKLKINWFEADYFTSVRLIGRGIAWKSQRTHALARAAKEAKRVADIRLKAKARDEAKVVREAEKAAVKATARAAYARSKVDAA